MEKPGVSPPSSLHGSIATHTHSPNSCSHSSDELYTHCRAAQYLPPAFRQASMSSGLGSLHGGGFSCFRVVTAPVPRVWYGDVVGMSSVVIDTAFMSK